MAQDGLPLPYDNRLKIDQSQTWFPTIMSARGQDCHKRATATAKDHSHLSHCFYSSHYRQWAVQSRVAPKCHPTCHPTSQICHSHTLVNLTQRAMALPTKGASTMKWVVCTCEFSGCKDKTFINEHGASQTGCLIAHSTCFDHWTKDHLAQLNSEVCECLIIVVACLPGFVGQTK